MSELPVYIHRSLGHSFRRSVDICSICLNLNLEHTPEENQIVRFDYFHLVESAELEDCVYCSLIYHALTKLGAKVKEDGYPFITSHAVPNKPFFVSWDDADAGLTYAEIFTDNGIYVHHI
jgi:hypothetical protein